MTIRPSVEQLLVWSLVADWLGLEFASAYASMVGRVAAEARCGELGLTFRVFPRRDSDNVFENAIAYPWEVDP